MFLLSLYSDRCEFQLRKEHNLALVLSTRVLPGRGLCVYIFAYVHIDTLVHPNSVFIFSISTAFNQGFHSLLTRLSHTRVYGSLF